VRIFEGARGPSCIDRDRQCSQTPSTIAALRYAQASRERGARSAQKLDAPQHPKAQLLAAVAR